MTFSVSNNGFVWSLDFGPDPFTLILKDLVQEMTISSQENPLAAWSFLLPLRQQFEQPFSESSNYPQTKRDNGDAGWNTSKGWCTRQKCKRESAFDLEDIGHHYEDLNMKMDAVIRPGIDILVLP